MSAHVLVVDDDKLIRRSLSLQLEEAGYRTTTAGTAEAALEVVDQDPPDLILLDVGLPGMDGLEALREIHRRQEIPVIFVTARRRELDTILGLELGADDYITKPFNPDILMAHVRAVLRRATRQHSDRPKRLQVGDLVVDPAGHTASVRGQTLELTAREMALLQVLAESPGRVFSIDELLDRAWGPDFSGEPQVVYVHIRWLREKLEEDPQNPERILNVRGAGYKLVAPDGTEEAHE